MIVYSNSNYLIRPYMSSDYQVCMDIFRGNTPRYFDPSEKNEFQEYLGSADLIYFVVEMDGVVIACGGTSVENSVGRLCWGMVDQTVHRSGIGKALLIRRINDLFRIYPVLEKIEIETSQFAAGFFERFGFRQTGVAPHGFGQGLDCVHMQLSRHDWQKV